MSASGTPEWPPPWPPRQGGSSDGSDSGSGMESDWDGADAAPGWDPGDSSTRVWDPARDETSSWDPARDGPSEWGSAADGAPGWNGARDSAEEWNRARDGAEEWDRARDGAEEWDRARDGAEEWSGADGASGRNPGGDAAGFGSGTDGTAGDERSAGATPTGDGSTAPDSGGGLVSDSWASGLDASYGTDATRNDATRNEATRNEAARDGAAADDDAGFGAFAYGITSDKPGFDPAARRASAAESGTADDRDEPRARPGSVTLAGVLAVLAAVALLLPIVNAVYDLMHLEDALRRAAAATGADAGAVQIQRNESRLSYGALIVFLVVASLSVLVPALFLRRGSNAARVLTCLSVTGASLLCGVGLAFAEMTPQLAERTELEAELTRLTERETPTWVSLFTVPVLFVPVMAFMILLLLLVPASNRFFRRRPPEPDTGPSYFADLQGGYYAYPAPYGGGSAAPTSPAPQPADGTQSSDGR